MLFGLQPESELILIAFPDDRKSTSGKRLPDECLKDNGIPQRLQTHTLSQTSSHPRHIRLHLITPGSWVLCWGLSRVFGSLTTRNPTCGIVKPSKVMSASKYLETSITSLLAADNQNNECASVKSPADLFNRGKMFLLKYFSAYQHHHRSRVQK